ncbi:unnamed protein product [Strongylus vulgaris]|uniref:L-type lectin-like domain-containing protein n=1 Tax=Strongylus vulgaris TaxID=40348 RepID=A0A3P7IMQ2_STRVU|nr:unnamed protein product [Strongylus vulgaris]
MWRVLLLLGVVTAQAPSASPSAAEVLAQSIDGTSVHEFRGYYKREHSLTRPYQGAGMEIPFWNIQGSSMVTSQQVRLTADEQSRQGAIWNMQHAHPYISAMVSDGSLHYDHDKDGTHTQLGGEHTGCEAKFRNKDHETQILIRYVGDTLSIFTDIAGKFEWKLCLSVNNVQLPTGYYFGISAATDNHDVIGVKMFEQEFAHVDRVGEGDRKDVVPRAEFHAAPRDHIDNPRPSKLGWFGTIVLVVVGIIVLVGVLGFGVIFFQKRSERQRKRFY